MKKHRWKRITAMFLSIALVLALLPSSMPAAEVSSMEDAEETRIETDWSDDFYGLPGWGWSFSYLDGAYIENADYPDGTWADCIITDKAIDITEGSEDTVFFEEWEDGTGFDIICGSPGTGTITFTYDLYYEGYAEDAEPDETGSLTVNFYVLTDLYDLSVTTDMNYMLPGTGRDLYVAVGHDFVISDEDDSVSCDWEDVTDQLTYTWEFADESDADVLTLSQDASDGSILHVQAADSLDEDRDVEILVTASDDEGNEIVAGDFRLMLRNEYYWIVLDEDITVEVDPNLSVGDTYTMDPQLWYYSSELDNQDHYEEIDDVQWFWEWDDSTLEVMDAEGNVLACEEEGYTAGAAPFYLTRLENCGSGQSLVAEIENEDGDLVEVTRHYFEFNGLDYSVWFDNQRDEGYTWGYCDEMYTLHLNTDNLSDKTGTDVLCSLGIWEYNEEEDTNDWLDLDNSEAYYTIEENEEEGGLDITLDITAIAEAMTGQSVSDEDFTFDGIYILVEVVLADAEDTVLYEDGVWVEYRNTTVIEFPYADDTLVPSWSTDISRENEIYFESPEYPWGACFDFSVTDVEITEGDTGSFELEEYDDSWAIRADEPGSITAEIVYEVLDENGDIYESGSYTITIDCVESLQILVLTADPDDKVWLLPGESVSLIPTVWCYTYDSESGETIEEELDAADYTYEIDYYDEDTVTVEKAEDGLSFTVTALDQIGGTWVSIESYEDGECFGNDGREFSVTNYVMKVDGSYALDASDEDAEVTISPNLVYYESVESEGAAAENAEFEIVPLYTDSEEYDPEDPMIADQMTIQPTEKAAEITEPVTVTVWVGAYVDGELVYDALTEVVLDKYSAADTLSVRRGNKFYISYSNSSSNADVEFSYGKSTDEVLVGDWDGDGVDTICVRRGNVYYFLNTECADLAGSSLNAEFYISYGKSEDEVLVGDWNGDGVDTLCVRRGSVYYFFNTPCAELAGGSAEEDFRCTFGKSTDEVLAGDWNGDGSDTVMMKRGNRYYVYNELESGDAEADFQYGKADDTAFAGDWNGDGLDTLCVRRDGNCYYFTNDSEGSDAGYSVSYGKSSDETFVGKWK